MAVLLLIKPKILSIFSGDSTTMKKIYLFFYFSILLSCDNKFSEDKRSFCSILITVGYYPTFHQHVETTVNLKDKYILFYSPNAFLPEPPPYKNREHNQEKEIKYQQYLAMYPKPTPFKTSIEEKMCKG